MKPTRMLSVRNFALALCVAVAAANGGVQNVTGSCEANRTMVHPKGQRAAILAVKRVNANRVPGDLVEVGVWMGGMSCILALTHLHDEAQSNSQVAKRNVWLFDTFQGMTAPTEDDGAVANKLYELVSTGGTPKVRDDPLRWNRDNRWNYSPLEEVRRTMAQSNFPEHRIHFVVGPAEETLRLGAEAASRGNSSATGEHEHRLKAGDESLAVPEQIAVMRLDTDWYASTKAELEVLWPRLQPGGFMAVDDYFTWGGASKAVNEWLQEHNWTQAAHDVHAFTHGGVNYVYKNKPFNASRPFSR